MPLSWRKGRERGTQLEHAAKIDDAVTTSWACFAREFSTSFPMQIFLCTAKRLVASNWT